MSQVRFNLRKNKKSEPHIYLIYRLSRDNKKLVLGTKLHIPEKYWNARRMRAKTTMEFGDHRRINAILDKWESSVLNVYGRYQLSGNQPSLGEFKKAVFQEFTGDEQFDSTKFFLPYFDQFIKLKRKAGLTENTIKIYRNAYNHFKGFIDQKRYGQKLEFNDLDRSFILSFMQYCQKDLGLEDNTINKIMKRFRAVMSQATKEGLNKRLDFRDKDCIKTYVKQPKVCVFEEELEMIRQLELEPGGRLDKIRDRFLIGFYTGLRISDLMGLSLDQVAQRHGIEIILLRTKKVGNRVLEIPMKPLVKDILLKYGGQIPKISDVKFNKYLKELFKKGGLDERVARIERGEQVFYEKWELITSHTMRRSFATNAILNGVNHEFVKKITGHSSLKQLYEYVCIDSHEFVTSVSENKYFQ